MSEISLTKLGNRLLVSSSLMNLTQLEEVEVVMLEMLQVQEIEL